jgi:2-polyprenyl-3-methyl-5-hydroxy-6-metoxy-1,4-benzoquinol methylase
MQVDSKAVTTKNYWNQLWSSEKSSKSVQKHDFYFGLDGIFKKMLFSQIGDIRNMNVIEFGGGGNNLRLLSMVKWHGAISTALDYSDSGIQTVEKLFSGEKLFVKCIHSDLENWNPTETYDLVCHWGLLEHFSDPKPILHKSYLALKPGQKLIFSMPNMNALGEILWKKWSPMNWSLHVNHSEQLIKDQLKEIGFTEIKSFYFGVPWIKMGPWEIKSIFQIFVDSLQLCVSLLYRLAFLLIPSLYKWNNQYLLMERVFIARK